MADLIKIENGQLAQQTIDYIKNVETTMKKAKEQYDAFKAELLKAMEESGTIKIENDGVSITYVAPTSRETFDSKLFKEDFPELYDSYVKFSDVKSSVRIKVK